MSSELLAKPSVHQPVLGQEVLHFLDCEKNLSFLDCTFGGGGHSRMILQQNQSAKVFAIDRDERAVKRGISAFSDYMQDRPSSKGRLKIKHASFRELIETVEGETFDCMLADLGLSSDQLEEERGFSFLDAESLDMRMDESQSLSAKDVVNSYSDRELNVVLKKGGVGKLSKNYVKAIIRARPLTNSKELAELIYSATPKKLLVPHFHPATIVLQAIRIEVNKEFEQIEALLDQAPTLIKENGRLLIITFHSGEDKLVTHRMRLWEHGRPVPALWRESSQQETPLIRKAKSITAERKTGRALLIDQGRKIGTLLTRKAVTARPEEVSSNSRSRSARLRVFEFC